MFLIVLKMNHYNFIVYAINYNLIVLETNHYNNMSFKKNR